MLTAPQIIDLLVKLDGGHLALSLEIIDYVIFTLKM